MSARVLLLGLDALDERIIQQAGAWDGMPELSALLERSLRGFTRWPRPLGTGALWPTVWSGVSPLRHRHPFWGETPDRRGLDGMRGVPFYARAAQHGRRVALVDAPYAPPGQGYLHVSDWLVHDMDAQPHVVGESGGMRAKDVAARLGQDRWCACDQTERRAQAHQALAARLVERIRRQAEVAGEVIGTSTWDLVVSVFSASHCAIHHLWQESPAGLGPLKQVLRVLDDAVGALVDAAGADASVLVLSGHGARPRTTASHLLPALLVRTFRSLPAVVRVRAARSLWPLLRPGRGRCSRRAWRALSYHEFAGAVRLWRRGRDGVDGVTPGVAARLIAALEQAAEELRDLETGAPAVTDVIVTAQRWPDEDLATWPDVFLNWNEDAPLQRVGSPRLGELCGRRWGHRSGDHRAQGFIALSGACAPGTLDESVSLTDVGPTVLSLLGVGDEGVDGRPFHVIGGPAFGHLYSS